MPTTHPSPFNAVFENFRTRLPNLLDLYGTAIRRMAMLESESERRDLEEQARDKGMVRWTALQKRKVGAVGFLTGLPGGLWAAPMELADITYLMAVAGRGCYGVGHIFNRSIDYKRDIPMILAVWSGSAQTATVATAGQAAMHFANPLIIQHTTPASVRIAGVAVTHLSSYAAVETEGQLLEKVLPKVLAKISTKFASKMVAKSVPVFGGIVACMVNRWICDGLMCAAEKYYSAPLLAVDQDESEVPAVIKP